MERRDHAVPAVLAPLEMDYEVLDTALAGLGEVTEPAARAELAEELVRRASLIEDTLEHAIYPYLEQHGEEPLLDHLAPAARAAGEAMVPVHKVVRHTVPMDVHTPDPVGVERSFSTVTSRVGEVLRIERQELFPLLGALSGDEEEALTEEVANARRHALEHPLPPQSPLHRLITRIEEHLEHHNDTSHQYRPNKEQLSPEEPELDAKRGD